MKTHKSTIFAPSDKAGIVSAILCTIHCLLVPGLFLMKTWWADKTLYQLPEWWSKLDYLFLLISFLAVYHSAGHTKIKSIQISLWVFWIVLAVAIVFESTLRWLAYVASAGLIITHFLNIRRMTRKALLQANAA